MAAFWPEKLSGQTFVSTKAGQENELSFLLELGHKYNFSRHDPKIYQGFHSKS